MMLRRRGGNFGFVGSPNASRDRQYGLTTCFCQLSIVTVWVYVLRSRRYSKTPRRERLLLQRAGVSNTVLVNSIDRTIKTSSYA